MTGFEFDLSLKFRLIIKIKIFIKYYWRKRSREIIGLLQFTLVNHCSELSDTGKKNVRKNF